MLRPVDLPWILNKEGWCLLLALILASASPGCASLAVGVTPPIRRLEAGRITTLTGQRVSASGVSYILADRNWRAVFATPDNAERGVFVLQRRNGAFRLVDTWGGILPPEERGQAAAWARSLKGGGVPDRLAACMDDAIIAGR